MGLPGSLNDNVWPGPARVICAESVGEDVRGVCSSILWSHPFHVAVCFYTDLLNNFVGALLMMFDTFVISLCMFLALSM